MVHWFKRLAASLPVGGDALGIVSRLTIIFGAMLLLALMTIYMARQSSLGMGMRAALLAICIAAAYGSIIAVHKLTAAIRRFIATGKRDHAASVATHESDVLAAALDEVSAQLEEAERLVRHYKVELEQRVGERTRQLHHLAHHDPLTQLPNRRQLLTYLESELQRAATAKQRVTLLFLDLDNFKTVNDTLGHHVGDLLLQNVGERLTASALERGFIARLGGDEFAVVCALGDAHDAVETLAAKVVEQFQRTVTIEGHNLAVGVSIGAAVFPEHANDGTSLLRAADAARFHAKEAGRNRFSIYGPQLLEATSTHFKIEQDLRRALEENEFELRYQPQLNLDTFAIGSVEALIRWRRSDGSMLLPAQFLAVAERSGLIKEINDWVLDTAARQVTAWRAQGWSDAAVAINISAQQLLDPSFMARFEATLRKHGLPPQALEIELTEGVFQTDSATIDALYWLRSSGVAVALDDFGTGYSSLTSIEQLPLTRVKIDRSLIKDIDGNPRYAVIVRSIVGLCRSLGLAVTAEGIERDSQFAFLHAQGGVDVQGYFISKPMRAAEMEEFRTHGIKRLRDLAAQLPKIDNHASLSDSMIVRQLCMTVNQ